MEYDGALHQGGSRESSEKQLASGNIWKVESSGTLRIIIPVSQMRKLKVGQCAQEDTGNKRRDRTPTRL